MPSFSDSIFLFVLALLLFGPKKLPVLARELGKWVGEFRRASNEFKMQMEEELRLSEQEDRQKQIAAMEAAAPVAQPVEEPPHPHLPEAAAEVAAESAGEFATEGVEGAAVEAGTEPAAEAVTEVLPIAISGELKMMPPSTGLPTARETREQSMEGSGDPLGGGLLDAIPSSSRHEDAAVALAAEGETRA
ncbi:MAG TPA: twin-arginine translocase TatA/TatE family subunit [Acidobacteriaceae bacterium]|nr:twin-arginine translocase TatA/TatE family subunit [Acidobacteriaceae bacterium]